MNVVTFEFKKYVGSLWFWIISLWSILVMFMAMYPVLARDAALVDLVLQHYPEELLRAFGMSGGLSVATVAGFFAFVFAFVQLCLAIQSAYYGFQFLSVEERELTADFLYSKPVSRSRLLLYKYVAAMAALLITNIGLIMGTFLSIEWFRGSSVYDVGVVISLLLSVPLFQLFFFSAGFLATALSKKITSVILPAVGLAFVLYAISALQRIVGGALLALVSPYNHFDPNYILQRGDWNMPLVTLSLVFIVAANVVAYFMFMRRDLHAAV